MSFTLPRIYPLTDVSISNLSHAEQFKRLYEGGAKMIQLREKNASPREFYEAAREVLALAGEKNIKVIINDRADIAYALKADGVHLGQDDLPPSMARKLLGSDAIIGFSTHTVAQARKACALPIDYIAIGPIFPTRTKKDAEQTVGLEGIRLVRQSIGDFPLVAIGGINLENAKDVLAAGADSVAVIGDLLSADNIADQLKQFIKL